jgi:hypothetical protein
MVRSDWVGVAAAKVGPVKGAPDISKMKDEGFTTPGDLYIDYNL